MKKDQFNFFSGESGFPFISLFVLLLASAKLFVGTDLTWLEVFYPIIIPIGVVGLVFLMKVVFWELPIFLGYYISQGYQFLAQKFRKVKK
jgi:hypothetical protein